MDYVEAEGGSIDEAIDNALKALGAERSKVEIEIIANASKGLFGIGGKKARVRATRRKPLDASSIDASPEPVAPRSTQTDPPLPTRPPPPAPAAEREQRTAVAPEVTAPASTDTAEEARSVLDRLLRAMGFDVAVDEEIADPADGAERVALSITGDSSGVLIGRHGQTLDALEYFVNRVIGREEEESARVVIDCERYRERRRHSLEEMALRMAERARKRGKAVTLSPMSPRDRRIVHLALQGQSGLTTRSSGKGHYRKVVIIPERERRTPAR